RYANGGLTSAGGHPTQIYATLPGQVEGLSADDLDGEAYFTIDDRAELVARWSEILAGKPDFLKIYLETAEKHAERRNDPEFEGRRGLDPSLIAPIVEKAHAAGLRVSAHTTSAFDFRAAVEAGVDELAHLPLAPLTEADAELAAAKGVVIVTTVVSHRPTDGIADVRALHRDNILLLKKHGVTLVLGTDSGQSVIDESRQLFEMGVYGAEEIVRLLTVDTPRYVFTDRLIGRLANDHEASFLALESNPLEDLGALSQIKLRVKAGHPIEIEAPKKLPSIGQAIANTIMHKGIEVGIEEYHRLRREQPNDYDFTEPHLNALGRALLQHNRVEYAIAVFELNAETYPNSADCYAGLGEAYTILGDKEKAIASYKRSLELDPHNQKAVKKLEELEEDADG
ncbi:MAG TPA: tetratricopeptide repeat protein, partial [Gemmatimonadota bacterium]|nr:tetratricopeptide repeat protein [Gemmatimonadota bacterium]